MKTNKLFAIIAMAAMWGAVACDDAKNVPIRGESDSDNRLYITEASVGSSKDIAMPKSGPAHIQITVRMIRPADHDVKVLLVADPTVLDEYNLEFATNYQLIEAVNYTVPNEVVIPAGSSSGISTYRPAISPFPSACTRTASGRPKARPRCCCPL